MTVVSTCHFPTTVVFAAASLLLGCRPSEPPQQANKTPKVVPVNAVAVEQTTLERTTTQPATIHPYYRAEIRAKVSGYVKEIKADIGDVVSSGDALATIAVPELQQQRRVFRARIARLLAEERSAETGVELAAADVRASEAQLSQAESELGGAEASLAASEAEFNRTEDLVGRQSVERRLLDEARQRRDAERARRESVVSAIEASKAAVEVAEARRKAAEADVESAKAETSIAQRQLDELDVLIAYATIKAPFSGVITRREVDPGDLVREGNAGGNADPLFVISQTDRLRIQIPVPETDAAFVEVGDAVRLTFPSFPAEEAMMANITRVAGSLDEGTRTMIAEAEVDNDQYKLLPGMFGQATITLTKGVAGNVLPARAVRFSESNGAFVYMIKDDNTVAITPVTTGRDDGRSIEIVEGLRPGQRVIDAHLKRFADGQPIKLLSK